MNNITLYEGNNNNNYDFINSFKKNINPNREKQIKKMYEYDSLNYLKELSKKNKLDEHGRNSINILLHSPKKNILNLNLDRFKIEASASASIKTNKFKYNNNNSNNNYTKYESNKLNLNNKQGKILIINGKNNLNSYNKKNLISLSSKNGDSN
jgi:hypothetical protein